MPPFGSPLRKLEVYYAVHFLNCWCPGPEGRTKREKRNKRGLLHPLGITVLPVGEVPFTQSFKPLLVPVTPAVTAAAMRLPRVWGVREHKRGVKG